MVHKNTYLLVFSIKILISLIFNQIKLVHVPVIILYNFYIVDKFCQESII